MGANNLASGNKIRGGKIPFGVFLFGLAIMAPAIAYLLGVLVWVCAVDLYNEWLAGSYTVLAGKALLTGATIAIAAGVAGAAIDGVE